MGTLFHSATAPSPSSMANKRPCPSSSPPPPPPASSSSAFNQVDHLFDAFLSLAESSSHSHSIDLSFDRLLESTASDRDQRSARKRATKYNFVAWALPPDLTIKEILTNVLNEVPGPTMSPGSSQPLVYTIRSSIDVSNFSWNDKKTRQGKESPIWTRTCLSPLSAAGHVELRQFLTSVGLNCHLIERLFFESSKTGRDDILKSPTCVDLVNNYPHLTSLSLRGFKHSSRYLSRGFQKLRYVDFSTSYSITGNFLRNLGSTSTGTLLEVLILRDCMHLKEVRKRVVPLRHLSLHLPPSLIQDYLPMEVARFLTAVLAGDFKCLRYVVGTADLLFVLFSMYRIPWEGCLNFWSSLQLKNYDEAWSPSASRVSSYP